MSEVPVRQASPAPTLLTRAERWSDRVNPIFLRELQQAFNGKAFLGVVFASMAAIFLIGLMIALRSDRAFENGRDVFIPILMVLTPVMTMVLPMQAFNSMQHELREGAVHQLLMSELTPRRIVRGKLLAAALLALVFMATFAPLLAVTYLLRGIDVATIATCLLFSFLFAVGAAAVGMAMGAVTMIKPLQHIARVGVPIGLAGLTITVMWNMWGIVRDVSRLGSLSDQRALIATAVALALGIVLLNLIAGAVLTHPYENRSTPFRAYPFAVTAVAYGMAFWMSSTNDFAQFVFVWAVTCWIGALPFFIAALTESRALSPRVRALVPKNRVLALLSVPFLPGSDRGLLFVLVLGAVLFGAAFAVWRVTGATLFDRFVPLSFIVLSYVWIWMCVLRTLRGNAKGQKARVRAIAGAVVLFALTCAGPAVFDVATRGHIESWTWMHVMNPFFTVGSYMVVQENPAIPTVLVVIALGCGLLRLPGMWRGVKEVMEASRARAG